MMDILKRTVVILLSLPVFLFCCFGYFATFEVAGTAHALAFGILYWVIGTLSLYLTARNLLPSRKVRFSRVDRP